MDHPERRYTQKCVTLKAKFAFGVRFSPFFASQHRGGVNLEKFQKLFENPTGYIRCWEYHFWFNNQPPDPPTPKWGTPKANFAFGVRFSPFLASQHRGGQLGKILKAIWKPNRVYTLLGISFLIQRPTVRPPHPKMWYSKREIGNFPFGVPHFGVGGSDGWLLNQKWYSQQCIYPVGFLKSF